jgi:hypothetical protein
VAVNAPGCRCCWFEWPGVRVVAAAPVSLHQQDQSFLFHVLLIGSGITNTISPFLRIAILSIADSWKKGNTMDQAIVYSVSSSGDPSSTQAEFQSDNLRFSSSSCYLAYALERDGDQGYWAVASFVGPATRAT